MKRKTIKHNRKTGSTVVSTKIVATPYSESEKVAFFQERKINTHRVHRNKRKYKRLTKGARCVYNE